MRVCDKLGSTNGTFLRLSGEKEPSEPYEIAAADCVVLGTHALTLEDTGGGGGAPAAWVLHVRCLRDATPPAEPLRLELGDSRRVTVGRAKANDVCLPSDQLVSGSHAELTRADDGHWSVRDFGSSNGTAVRLAAEKAPSRAFALRVGHSLALGAGPKCSELRLCRFRVGIAERQGRRPSMEDAYVALERLAPPPNWAAAWPSASFYAVYDGHAGAEASAFARTTVHRHFLRHLADARDAANDNGGGTNGGAPSVAELGAAMRAAFLSTDELFLRSTRSTAGSTAVAAVVDGAHIVVANAGDSRACLWRNGRALPLSIDHKPDAPEEEARIVAAGGFVSHGRVLSALAVSRALGDRDFKLHAGSEPGTPFHASLVVAEPDVRVARVQPGDMLLLACDGLWDVFTPEGAFAYLEAKGASAQPQRAVQQLCKAAEEEYGSLDNITAVLVQI